MTHSAYHKPFSALLVLALWCALLLGCNGEVEHTAEAIRPEDSLPFMHSRGINTLISDSGVIRYRMVAEEWDIYNPEGGGLSTWKFMKGLLMERFDEKFHVDLYVQADTAYLHQQYLWELHGRVVIRNIKNEVFRTEELFWDMDRHEMWSHKFIRIITPERELQGNNFRSNETMTRYWITNSSGSFPVEDTQSASSEPADTSEGQATATTDSFTVVSPAPQKTRTLTPSSK